MVMALSFCRMAAFRFQRSWRLKRSRSVNAESLYKIRTDPWAAPGGGPASSSWSPGTAGRGAHVAAGELVL